MYTHFFVNSHNVKYIFDIGFVCKQARTQIDKTFLEMYVGSYESQDSFYMLFYKRVREGPMNGWTE